MVRTPKLMMCAGLFALALVAGCGGDDPVAPTTVPLDGPLAEEWTTNMLASVNAIVTDVPTLAAGDFATLAAAKNFGDPVWDEAQQAWVFAATLDLSEGDPPTSQGQLAINAWVQYRNADGPLPSALGATELEYHYEESMTLHAAGENGVIDLTFAASAGMTVGYAGNSYDVSGGGDATVHAMQAAGGRVEQMDLDMAWGLDVGLPVDGCPDGAAWVAVGQYRLDAAYDGQGNVPWTVVGPGYQANGTEVLACGPVQ